MPTKAKNRTTLPSIQQLKDRLWAMACTIDYTNDGIVDVQDHPDYEKWDQDMQKRPVTYKKVPGFDASTTDIGKIIQEVDDSCLTSKCKETLTKALKSALK